MEAFRAGKASEATSKSSVLMCRVFPESWPYSLTIASDCQVARVRDNVSFGEQEFTALRLLCSSGLLKRLCCFEVENFELAVRLEGPKCPA